MPRRDAQRRVTDPAAAATPAPAAVHPWDAQTYDDRFCFVAEFGRDLIGLLEPRDGERILDLGCGTGTLTAQLAPSGAEVVGVDADPGMVRQARCAPQLCRDGRWYADYRRLRFLAERPSDDGQEPSCSDSHGGPRSTI